MWQKPSVQQSRGGQAGKGSCRESSSCHGASAVRVGLKQQHQAAEMEPKLPGTGAAAGGCTPRSPHLQGGTDGGVAAGGAAAAFLRGGRVQVSPQALRPPRPRRRSTTSMAPSPETAPPRHLRRASRRSPCGAVAAAAVRLTMYSRPASSELSSSSHSSGEAPDVARFRSTNVTLGPPCVQAGQLP